MSLQIKKRKAYRKDGWTREKSRRAHIAKARIRMERAVEREPQMIPWNRFLITVKDRLTGESASFELVSVRDAAKRLAVVLKYCQ